MKVELRKRTEKFTGKVMHYIYVDDTFITCKIDANEAQQAFEEAVLKAQLYPEDKEEVIRTFSL